MLRVRFYTNYEDPRPVNWPVKHPWWETGVAADESYAIIVSYADDVEYIKTNWPDASEIDVVEDDAQEYNFTSRFPEPTWMTDTSRLNAYGNGNDTVIAYSPEDAVEVWEESTGGNYDFEENEGFYRLEDDEMYTLTVDDRFNPTGIEKIDEYKWRATLRQWIAVEGRAFLGSIED